MANAEQLAIWKQGVKVWNKWRLENITVDVDLSGSELNETFNLSGAYLMYANLSDSNLSGVYLIGAVLNQAVLTRANLEGTVFSGANLFEADLRGAILNGADFQDTNLKGADLSATHLKYALFNRANLTEANLSKADLRGAVLSTASLALAVLKEAVLHQAYLVDTNCLGANFVEANLSGAFLQLATLSGADLRGADLREANLTGASLVGTKIDKAKISGSSVYGINVWDLKGEFEEQKDLVITPGDAPIITVDNIKVAQFIYLILNNEEIRDVLNTLTSKTVLILGRFADDKRKSILDALRNKLREYNLLPIVFDFDRPIDRNITETVKTLAAISYFVIADVTSPKSSPLELQAIIPDFQIPVVPIIQEEELPFSMIADLQSQHKGVLDPLTYHSEETLIKALKAAVIDPAIEKHYELRLVKAQKRNIRKAEDFIEDKGLDNQSSAV